MRIAVIGICGAGKSTLVQGLRMLGFDAKQVNQEHSEVKLLWERFYQPDVLIWLDAGDAEIARRLGTNLEPWLIARQRARLSHALGHCDLYLHTDHLTPEEVLAIVITFLEQRLRHNLPQPGGGWPERAPWA